MNDSPGWASPGSDNSGTSPSDEPDAPGLPEQAGPPVDETSPATGASSSAGNGDASTSDAPPPVGSGGGTGPSSEPTAATEDADAARPEAVEPRESGPSAAPEPPAPMGSVPPNWSVSQPPPGDWGHTTPPPSGPGQPVPPPPPGPNMGIGAGPAPGPQAGWGPAPGGAQPGWGWSGAPGGPNPYWGAPPPPPKPGVIPLRPLDVGDIFNGAFATIRKHWRQVLGVAFVVSLLIETAQTLLSGLTMHNNKAMTTFMNASPPTVGDMERFYRAAAPAFIGSAGLTILAQILATSMLILIVSRAVLGRPVALAEVWRDARPRMLPMLGLLLTMVLIGIGTIVAGIAPGLIVSLAGSSSAGAGLGLLGFLAAIYVLLWLVFAFSLATPTLMLEQQGVFASLSRSFKLVRKSWWRVCGIQLLGSLLTVVAGALIQSPFVIITTLMNGSSAGGTSSLLPSMYGNFGWSSTILLAVGATIASTFTLPVSAGIGSLLYIDLRIRREGLDVELARAAGVQGYTAP